jgi:prevent-host-death family protein
MKSSRQIRSIRYLLYPLSKGPRRRGCPRSRRTAEPLVITQNGEAKAVLQDVASYEETQERLAFLKILALGNRQIEEGRPEPAAEAVQALRERLRTLG